MQRDMQGVCQRVDANLGLQVTKTYIQIRFVLNQFNSQVSRIGRERRHRHGARIGIVLQDDSQHSRLFDPDDQHQLSYWPIDQDRRGIKNASVENRSNRQV